MKKILLLSTLAALSACSVSVPVSNQNVDLVVEQSHTLIKAGESVTFTAHATGVAGRDEEIKWETKGGDLYSLNDSERYARVEFDKPGMYAVQASLYVDGKLVDQERSMVQVEPVS